LRDAVKVFNYTLLFIGIGGLVQLTDKAKKDTESVTFRLNKHLLSELRREADNKQITLNNFASQIFRQFMSWHFSAAKAGWIPVQREMLRRMIDKATDEEVNELAVYMAKSHMPDLILLLRREYDFASFLDVMEACLKVSQFPYNHNDSEGRHVFVIQHELGRKWSLYMAQLFRSVCEELASRPDIMVTDNTVTIRVDAVKCGIAIHQ
jgi:hypothetical protein